MRAVSALQSPVSTAPILVTGSHRSGSTWAGHMLAHAPRVAYIHEPFHVGHRRGLCNATFDRWYTYICNENESTYLRAVEDCLGFKYHTLGGLSTINSLKGCARLVWDYLQFTTYRWFRKRPLVKDPIAVFSADWLARRFDMDVVVLIRHPAAFVGSLKKARWSFSFQDLLEQPLLMQHHLHPFEAEIKEYAGSEKDVVDQGILLWNVIHHVILHYRQRHPADWLFVRHEDLSRRPLQAFQEIYDRLGLTFTKQIEREIARYSLAAPSINDSTTGLQRHSESNVATWKTRLTPDEIQRVKTRTHEIAREFYDQQDWNV